MRQTVPENGVACPGEKIQYLCTSSLGQLSWQIDGSFPVTFREDMEVNSSGTIEDFSLVLTEKIVTENGTTIFSTATNDMVTSKYNSQQVVCYLGVWASFLYIEVAGSVNSY